MLEYARDIIGKYSMELAGGKPAKASNMIIYPISPTGVKIYKEWDFKCQAIN
jgi:hypothetical protein